ncbi:MAG: F0F1 ATP synthase subunit A, partial [Candidatus Sungbacteria bacterium]|nr:F0F1 ATP synthase subunit A [Candidatus Sungbacteria bacterium]
MPHIEIAAEKLAEILGFPITNALISSWLAVGLLVAVALLLRGKVLLVPQALQNVVEFFMESFLTLMEGVLGSRAKAEKYFPIVGTVFLFILTSNWLGILPGVGSIGFFEETAEHGTRFVPLLRSAVSDLNVTLALATITVLAGATQPPPASSPTPPTP